MRLAADEPVLPVPGAPASNTPRPASLPSRTRAATCGVEKKVPVKPRRGIVRRPLTDRGAVANRQVHRALTTPAARRARAWPTMPWLAYRACKSSCRPRPRTLQKKEMVGGRETAAQGTGWRQRRRLNKATRRARHFADDSLRVLTDPLQARDVLHLSAADLDCHGAGCAHARQNLLRCTHTPPWHTLHPLLCIGSASTSACPVVARMMVMTPSAASTHSTKKIRRRSPEGTGKVIGRLPLLLGCACSFRR